MSTETTYHIIFIASNDSDYIYKYDEKTENNDTIQQSSNNDDIIGETCSRFIESVKKIKFQENIQFHICEWITKDKGTLDSPILYNSQKSSDDTLVLIKDGNFSTNQKVSDKLYYEKTLKHIKDNYYKDGVNKTIFIFLAHSFGVGYFYQDNADDYLSTLCLASQLESVFGNRGVSLFFGINCSIMNIENCIFFKDSVEYLLGSQMAFFPSMINFDTFFQKLIDGINNDEGIENSMNKYVDLIRTENSISTFKDIPYFNIGLISTESINDVITQFNKFSNSLEFKQIDGTDHFSSNDSFIINSFKQGRDISTNYALGWFDIIDFLKFYIEAEKNLGVKLKDYQIQNAQTFLEAIRPIIINNYWTKSPELNATWDINGISFHIPNEHNIISLKKIIIELFNKYTEKKSDKENRYIDYYQEKADLIGKTFIQLDDRLINIIQQEDLKPGKSDYLKELNRKNRNR